MRSATALIPIRWIDWRILLDGLKRLHEIAHEIM